MDNIEDIIEDILSQKDSTEVYTTKYKEFSEKYPTLFEKLFEPNFDKAVLRYMLNQKGKMSSNKQTEHDASIKVGTMLVDKYVKPNLT